MSEYKEQRIKCIMVQVHLWNDQMIGLAKLIGELKTLAEMAGAEGDDAGVASAKRRMKYATKELKEIRQIASEVS